jgi:transcriptional regulator with XRE-family HTH domain
VPSRNDPDAPASVPAFYGAELRLKREAAGLTLQQLANGSFYSVSFLSQIERGQRRIPLDLARHADRVLRTDGFFERRCEDARSCRRTGLAGYFADAAEQEKRAVTITEWAPSLVPGLLQTAGYARAVIRAANPFAAPDHVETLVTARGERAQLLADDAAKPEFWVIVSELLLRQRMAEPAVMREQFTHLARMARQSRAVIQVLPLSSGPHPLIAGGMTKLMTFADAPPTVYTEGAHHGQLIDDPALVRAYAKSYDFLRAAALSPEASLSLIESAAKDLGHEHARRPQFRGLPEGFPRQRGRGEPSSGD